MTASATAPLRLIQVGAGGMGRAWLSTISAEPDAQLVGLVDLDEATARAALAEAGLDVPVATSLAGLPQTQADAVVNVTVPRAHLSVNAEAMRTGLPVLCEKPLSETLDECLRAAALSEATGVLLMVSQSRRYWRALTTLRRQLATLGQPELVSCTFAKAPHFGGFRDAMAHPLLVDMAIHQFDLARDLIGSEPVAVFAAESNPSWSWYAGDAAASAIFTFADGARFTYDGSWCSAGLETSWNGAWRVAASHGSAVWDGDHAPTAETTSGEALDRELPDGPEEIAGSLREFVGAVRGGDSRPTGEVHTNVASVAMVLAAVESARTGRVVRLAELVDAAWAEAQRSETDPATAERLRSWTSAAAVVGLA